MQKENGFVKTKIMTNPYGFVKTKIMTNPL